MGSRVTTTPAHSGVEVVKGRSETTRPEDTLAQYPAREAEVSLVNWPHFRGLSTGSVWILLREEAGRKTRTSEALSREITSGQTKRG